MLPKLQHRVFVPHQWTDGFVEGSTQDVAEDQESQPLTFLVTKIGERNATIVFNLNPSAYFQITKVPKCVVYSLKQHGLTELSWFVVLCGTRATLWWQADRPWPRGCSPDVLSFSQSYSTSGCAAFLHRLQTQSPLRHIHTRTNRNKYTQLVGKRPKGPVRV